MDSGIGKYLKELADLISRMEDKCEYPDVNCLMQRLLDARFDFEEVYSK